MSLDKFGYNYSSQSPNASNYSAGSWKIKGELPLLQCEAFLSDPCLFFQKFNHHTIVFHDEHKPESWSQGEKCWMEEQGMK